MLKDRYKQRRHSDGSWSVIDKDGDAPAAVGNKVLIGLGEIEAADLAVILNLAEQLRSGDAKRSPVVATQVHPFLLPIR